MPVDRPNTPPADELFSVRDEIKRLKAREEVLRTLMLSDPSARTGNLYAVEIKTVTTKRTDLKEMRLAHPTIVDEFTHALSEQRVEIRGITEAGELISLRSKAAQ